MESYQGRTQADIQMMSTEFFLSYWDKSSINFYKPDKGEEGYVNETF